MAGIRDRNGKYMAQEIQTGLRKLGLVHNWVYQRMRGTLKNAVYIEYFPGIDIIMVYGYPGSFGRTIEDAVRGIRSVLDEFDPEYLGRGNEHIHSGEMTLDNTGCELDREIEEAVEEARNLS